MSTLDEVPFKIPLGTLEEAKEEVELVTAPEIPVPDYLTILQDTQYEFSLEKWVLTGLQGGYPSPPRAPVPRSPSEVLASCPPYWLMFSSPQESRLASRHSSDFWEPNPRPRSHSLNPARLSSRVKFVISDSEEEGEAPEEPGRSAPESVSPGGDPGSTPRCRSPNLLDLPGVTQLRRQNPRQSSLSAMETSLAQSLPCPSGPPLTACSRTPSSAPHRPPHCRAQTLDTIPAVTHHKLQSLSPCLPAPPSVILRPLNCHRGALDSSVELLSALSPEERELLEAITERGYPLRTAIIALQKAGRQSPEQILSYLVASDRLCQRGYDEAQVEEALEMFQNCETKAEEFLQLLNQFNEMGFQQNAIKEVLLVHENHRERALEELMMRVA